jgi:hypothetical protein
MSEPSAFGFGKFVPGFDFLQNLSKTAAQAQPSAATGMPGMGSWVAPTLSIEDIDKRIQELKSVLFWLEQNTTALKATIQAMEVQKMTLTTLQSMNVNMADLAKAFTVKPVVAESAPADAHPASSAIPKTSLFTPKQAPSAAVEPEPAKPFASPSDAPAAAEQTVNERTREAAQPAVDPMQWWGALTQQFQGIAAAAMKDVAGEAMKAGMAAKSGKARQSPASRQASAGPSAAGKPAASKSAKAPVTSRGKATVKARAKSAAAKSTQSARSATKPVAARKTTQK